ncbi:MAG TPA: putative dsRNA-binding protein [Solirubrobacteraceae bacterium]|jgi:ribonuclease-3|nr:putative dsRNA-binding protein [Solirubrobacteraceae bacterium]
MLSDRAPARPQNASENEGDGTGTELPAPASLEALLEALPADLATQVFTHSSWSERRGASYDRLAFLGDSVLALAVTSHLYPRLEADRFGAGRLTKIRAQAVSGPSCRAVAERLGVTRRLQAAAPAELAHGAAAMLNTERVLASVIEAVIGACFLNVGYERTAAAVVEAFTPEIEQALEHPVDFKSALQEMLAQRGEVVSYAVTQETGPPHDRIFEVAACVDGKTIGSGNGRSKKIAEQHAARQAVERLQEA